MSDALIVGIVVAAVGAVLTLVGTLMVRSMNGLKAEVLAAKGQLQVLVTEVAVQGNNHSHVAERLAIAERSTTSAHKRLDEHGDRIVRLEAWRDAGNPEVRR